MSKAREDIEGAFAAALAAGVPPHDERAIDIAEELRLHIDANHYPCTHSMHRRLGDMYEADPRFRNRYNDRAPGLASYIAQAIRANAERHERGVEKPHRSAEKGGGGLAPQSLPGADSRRTAG